MDGSDDDVDSEPDEEEAEVMRKWMQVNDKTFEEMELPPKVVTATQRAWNGFVSVFEKRETAADALYGAFFDAAPNLQGMFRAPRAAMGLRILAGMETFIINAGNPPGLRKEVEAIAFNHLDLDVTGPRVELFRESTLEVFDLELGALFGTRARLGLSAVMTYAGGAYIHCRREYAARIRLLQRSWNTAAKKGADVGEVEDLDSKSDESEEEEEVPQETEAANEVAKTQEGQEGVTKASALKVPTTFDEMFLFNAAVMGYLVAQWYPFPFSFFGSRFPYKRINEPTKKRCPCYDMVAGVPRLCKQQLDEVHPGVLRPNCDERSQLLPPAGGVRRAVAEPGQVQRRDQLARIQGRHARVPEVPGAQRLLEAD